MSNVVLSLQSITKSYGASETRVDVLRGVTLTLHAGEMVTLVGPSGCGKSTLLHIIGLLDKADGGQMHIAGEAVKNEDNLRTNLRGRTIGFVYQFHHLLPEFSALENVVIPQMVLGKGRGDAEKRALHLLTQVGLAPRASHRPAELSGGEQQRVAIARALANHPKLLVADEPTGNLDVKNSELVFNVLKDVCKSEGTAILMATHNLELARQLNRVIHMKEGIVSDS